MLNPSIYGFSYERVVFTYLPHVHFSAFAKVSLAMSSKEENPTHESGPPHSVPDPAHHDQEVSLGEYELSSDRRPPFILTWAEVKLLGIAGVSSRFTSAKPRMNY